MRNWLKENWFKIIAVLILFGGLGTHPYSYYQFLRWAVCLAGIYAAYLYYKKGQQVWVWIFGIIAVLFNPVAPFYLSRSNWQLFDAIGGTVFFISLFSKRKHE